MTGSSLTLELDDQTLARLTTAAAALGLRVDAYARDLLEAAVRDQGVREGATAFEGAHDWTEARRRLAEYDRTGEHITLDDWLAEFRADVKSRLAG